MGVLTTRVQRMSGSEVGPEAQFPWLRKCVFRLGDGCSPAPGFRPEPVGQSAERQKKAKKTKGNSGNRTHDLAHPKRSDSICIKDESCH